MRAVDCFTGAGGASRGLTLAGYEVVGFDNWQPAVDTHNANGMPCHLHDLSDPALDHLIPEADLGWFSCPCQPFSAAGDGEGEFDDRDGFPWALRIIAARRFPVVMFENVKGLTFRKHHAYFAGILASLRALGYDVDWRVLNSADFGVPQTRERCFIVGRLDGGPITWPMPTHTETAGMFTQSWVTMADALGWGLNARPYPAVATGHSDAAGVGGSGARSKLYEDRDAGRWVLDYRQTDGKQGLPILLDVTERPSPTIGTQSEGQWIVRTNQRTSSGDSMYQRSIDEPAPSVTSRGDNWWLRPATTIAGDTRVFQPGGHHQPGGQSQNAIRLTIADLARLQDFPADWIWTGTKTQQARMIGNACPATFARLLAEANMPVTAERVA